MTSDPAEQSSVSTVTPSNSAVDCHVQVRLKREGERLLLILPPTVEMPGAASWSDLWEQLKHRLNAGDRFWQAQSTVHLMASDQLLDGLKLQAIADALSEVQLQLSRVYTSRRQTAVAAATAGYSVEQQSPTYSLNQTPTQSTDLLAEPLYLQMTVRSGVEIRHPGTIVILGDLNPGGAVIAAGDILIWGSLRGIAHAGASGNRSCRIMALKMEPTQLRIADAVARAPETPPTQFHPEVAYVTLEGIRIARATDFSKTHLSLNS
ncbi:MULTISPECIES: septum site-determining protein MinC [unclassified Coleofasciculus]|uniref:septum site-determining protein MinC n=1 Tax=unclassified Coleofasciculus TaxID=2692782 RepID=UPI001881C2BA|nr:MULTISPECIES: septum site-determining protein MinC [unclassified Coleofasciculus]MBE9129052.1 septum site-determining protein MinC [Coleofasciculus sp. LEGE 07081]MBE9151734.1 septum site-determining protein MinC [Coleofasciculus sp. LEGE 07092]